MNQHETQERSKETNSEPTITNDQPTKHPNAQSNKQSHHQEWEMN